MLNTCKTDMKLLKNSIIMPLEGTMDYFTGGVFSSDGQFIEDSLLDRGKPRQLQEPIESLDGIYIYGGCLFGHFGHFIWESLSRLYTIRKCKEYPILFITPYDEIIISIFEKSFKAIGVRNKIFFVKVPTSVQNLIYSPPGSSIMPLFIIDEQINALKYFTFSNTERVFKKIWLSRSLLNSNKYGKITNEQHVEEELNNIGYEIIHPQMISLYQQVRLLSTSDIVAGFDGSQFFSVLFAKAIRSKFFVFNRRKNIPNTIPYIFKKRNIEFSLHNFDLEYVSGVGACTNFCHHEIDKIIDTLK